MVAANQQVQPGHVRTQHVGFAEARRQVGFKSQIHVYVGIFFLDELDILAHVAEIHSAHVVHHVSEAVVGNGYFLKPDFLRGEHVFFNRALAVGIYSMSMVVAPKSH